MCGALLIVDPAEPSSLDNLVKWWQVPPSHSFLSLPSFPLSDLINSFLSLTVFLFDAGPSYFTFLSHLLSLRSSFLFSHHFLLIF